VFIGPHGETTNVAIMPVIKAESAAISDARLSLVNSTRIVFRNALKLLGIEALDRM